MFMIILERLLHKVELSTFISVDEYLLKILTEHENQFCFVFFFPPTTRKWKLSVKKKTEIELKYFSMLFFRDMYIASFFFFQSNVDSNPCWSFARKSLNNAEGVGYFSIYAVPDAWIF